MDWTPLFPKSKKGYHLSKYFNFLKNLNPSFFRKQILNFQEKKKHMYTLYIGNLSYLTREEQLWVLFSRLGEVKRIIMGIHRYNLTPCGFCFVEFFEFHDSYLKMVFLSGLRLDGRILRIDMDEGFINGRQYGRGKRGGQTGDEYKKKKKWKF
mmetsp:Transcript_14105/g.28047  ORF Transcript_14105/g.28047 Transcript_14105/m.28047 type:complete len:153 (+) Transcript_14105:2594-3052(+)